MAADDHEDNLGYTGQLLGGRYFIDRAIGQGAFAIVYHAITEHGEEAAIKISRTDDRAAIFRFTREVKVMESLPSSPHLVAYKSHGTTPDGRLYLAMEYVPGPTLADGLRSRPVLAPDEAAACVGQISLALQTLHRFQIVHRDLKPSNVLLAKDGLVKLFDFGLVLDSQRMLRMFESDDLQSMRGQDFAEEIERGIVVGTPEYMAVEQFEDAKATGLERRQTCLASDVFSAGVILYRLITGRVPFPMRFRGKKPTTREIVDYLQFRTRITTLDLIVPPEIDGPLWNILSRALSNVPWMRQPNGKALADELFGYLLQTRRASDARPTPLAAPIVHPDTQVTGPPEPPRRATPPPQTRLTAQELFGDLDLSTSYSFEERPPAAYEEAWDGRR
jgi:serine/threonine protein kinase